MVPLHPLIADPRTLHSGTPNKALTSFNDSQVSQLASSQSILIDSAEGLLGGDSCLSLDGVMVFLSPL